MATTEVAPQLAPEPTQEQQGPSEHDRIIARLNAAFPNAGLPDSQMKELADNMNTILETAATAQETLGTEEMTPQKKMAYEITQAYVDLANLNEQDDTNAVVAEDLAKATEFFGVKHDLVFGKRDYKDNLSEYEEKAAERVAELQTALAPTWDRQTVVEDRQKKVARDIEQKKAQARQQQIDAERKAAHNKNLEEGEKARKADAEAREKTRKEFLEARDVIESKRARAGEGRLNNSDEENEAEADAVVESKHGPVPDAPNVIDTQKLKIANQQAKQKQAEEREKTAKAAMEFQKSFPNPDEKPAEAEWFTAPKPDLAGTPGYENIILEPVRAKLEVAQAQGLMRTKNTILRDDARQVYAVIEGTGEHGAEHSQAAADAIGAEYAKNNGSFASLEDAKKAMQDAFNSVPAAIEALGTDADTFGTVAAISVFDGKTYAIVGSTGGPAIYRSNDDGELTRLAASDETRQENGMYFDAVELNSEDRLVICSENMTEDQAILETALDKQKPLDGVNYFVDTVNENKDTSALFIDVEPELTDEELAELEAEDAAEAATQVLDPAEEVTLIRPARTEIRGPKKPLGFKARAKVLAQRMFGNALNMRDNNGNLKTRAKITAGLAVGVAAVSLAFGATKFNNYMANGGNSDSGEAAAKKAAEANQAATGSAAEQRAAAAIEAWSDKVEQGDGITKTFMDYARSSGKDISPERAMQIFNKALNTGLINVEDISDISPQDVIGGVGFADTASTTLSPDMLEFLNKELDR